MSVLLLCELALRKAVSFFSTPPLLFGDKQGHIIPLLCIPAPSGLSIEGIFDAVPSSEPNTL